MGILSGLTALLLAISCSLTFVQSEVSGSQSVVLRQILEGNDVNIMQTFEDEAYDVCKKYVNIHDARKNLQNSLYQGQSARDESSMQVDDDGDQVVTQNALTQREIRRSPSRNRNYHNSIYRSQGEDNDYGSSNELGRQVPSRKRSCIRRGSSCDARPGDCCYKSSCRCNLWGTNCRCMRMGLIHKWINGR